MEYRDIAIGVVLRGGQILITRRKQTGPFAGLWEFPGGKCEPGELPEQCLKRELWEELEIRVKPVIYFSAIKHAYPHVRVCLHPYLCLHEAGEPKLLQCDEARWIEPRELANFQFPQANQPLNEQVMATLASKPMALSGQCG